MVALFGTFNNQCTFFRRGSADDVHFSRIISYDGLLDKATTPLFRHLSSRRGIFSSLITGALKTAATSTVGDTSAVESVMDMSKWIIPGTSINIGNFLSAIINFLILAFIIFCVVKGLNKLNDKFKKKVEEEVTPAGPTQEELLAEIRDLLKDKE